MNKRTSGLLLSVVSLLLVVLVPWLSGDKVDVDEVMDKSEKVLGEMQGFEALKEGEFLVAKVVDGDTIELSDGSKVRYIGVDTPETVKPRTEIECYGKEASEYNKSLVEGQVVTLEKDVSETDRYGRLLRYVYVGNMMVNEILVQEGYAMASAYPPDVKYQDRFEELEAIAREEGRGLWGLCELSR